jgi:hypothetical protein
VAPAGFLVIEKTVVALFGASELALRAFPLACGLLAMVLFWRVSARVLTGWAVPFAVGLVALGMPFIYFSVQVKQYSSDVAAALAVLLLSIDLRARGMTRRRALAAGLAGAALVWFSQPVLFLLAAIGAALVVLAWRERARDAAIPIATLGALWASSAAAVVWTSLRSLSAKDGEYFRAVWAEGFMPMPPERLADLIWPLRKITWAFGVFVEGVGRTHGGLNYRWSVVFTAVMLFGLWRLWRTRRDVALFLALPIVLVAALSAARLYPFTARLFLFLQPSLLLATAAGAGAIASSPRVPNLAGLALLAVLVGSPLFAAATSLPPFWLQHTRPLVEHLQARLEPRDVVYVYYAAGQALYYYAPRYRLPLEQVRMGQCSAGSPRGYLRQLDELRGRDRVWVLISHATRNGTEAELMLAYLEAIGRRVEAVERPGTSGRWVEAAMLYLYDLSDSDRLRAASAVDFPVPGGILSAPASPFACYGVAAPISPLARSPQTSAPDPRASARSDFRRRPGDR